MKQILLFIMMLAFSIPSLAQTEETEKAKPMTDTEIVRKCSILDIEGTKYEDVTVTIKSNQPDFFWTDKYKVKVSVTDAEGNKIWNKTFKNVFLYIFKSGQVQIGKPNFDKMVISKSIYSDTWIGVVREKEGVY